MPVIRRADANASAYDRCLPVFSTGLLTTWHLRSDINSTPTSVSVLTYLPTVPGLPAWGGVLGSEEGGRVAASNRVRCEDFYYYYLLPTYLYYLTEPTTNAFVSRDTKQERSDTMPVRNGKFRREMKFKLRAALLCR